MFIEFILKIDFLFDIKKIVSLIDSIIFINNDIVFY